jgi:predicted CopG family antitoxin
MRKKKYPKNVGVLLTDDTYEKLVQVTNKKEIPMSEYIRMLIENKINREEKTNNE